MPKPHKKPVPSYLPAPHQSPISFPHLQNPPPKSPPIPISHPQATPSPSPTPPRPPSNRHSTCQDLWRMLLKHLLEVSARMAGGMLCHRLRGAHHHDLSSLTTPIRTEINDPVGTADNIEVVLFTPITPTQDPPVLLLFLSKN